MTTPHVDMLRRALATITYRLDKVIVNAPPDFGGFDAGSGVRTPAEILAHIGGLLAWASEKLTGAGRQPHTPRDWQQEIKRFETIAATLNRALLDWNNPDPETALRLLQGPFADALTHVGQLAMLCRMAGKPISAESFYDAPINALEESE